MSCLSTLQFIPLTFRDKNSPLHRLFTGFCKLSMRCDIFLPSVLIIKLSNVNAQHKGNKIKAFYCHSYGLRSEVVCPCCFGCRSFHSSCWESMTALKTACRRVVTFGTLIVVGLNSPLTHLWVSQSEPLAKLNIFFCFKLLNHLVVLQNSFFAFFLHLESTESCVLSSPSKHDRRMMFKLSLIFFKAC